MCLLQRIMCIEARIKRDILILLRVLLLQGGNVFIVIIVGIFLFQTPSLYAGKGDCKKGCAQNEQQLVKYTTSIVRRCMMQPKPQQMEHTIERTAHNDRFMRTMHAIDYCLKACCGGAEDPDNRYGR